jgi:GTP-binding protein Era
MSKSRGRRNPVQKHRSGFVSILGRPNAGKSTLLNALIGAKVAIVTDKPQTTRTLVQGVWTEPNAQIVFLDTPGIHDAQSLINRRMMKAVAEALEGRDLLLYVIDATREASEDDAKALEWLKRTETPAIAVINKIDLLDNHAQVLPVIERHKALHDFAEYVPLSAAAGDGVDALRKLIARRLPAGPAYFPEDHLTDQPERFLLAEIIREKILQVTRQEVPHSVAVTIEQWEETPRLAKVEATIHVEREGQKPIIVGTGGARLKEIGTQARVEAEQLLGRKLFLQLYVRVTDKWRERESFLDELDWRKMQGAEPREAIEPTGMKPAAAKPEAVADRIEEDSSGEAGNEHNGEELS